MDIIIREARSEDAERLLEYLKRIGGESDNLTFGAEGLPFSVDDEKRFIEGVAKDEKSVMLLAFDGDEIVGDASLSSMPRRMSHRAELGISVVKSHWGQGIGSALLAQTIDYARQNGIEIIDLNVRSDNERAIHLYKKFGFKYIGTHPSGKRIKGEDIPLDYMYLDLV